MKDIKKKHSFTQYQKRSFRGTSTNGKPTGIKCVACQVDYFEENYCFKWSYYLCWHCWRSKNQLNRDVLLWTPSYGHIDVS